MPSANERENKDASAEDATESEATNAAENAKRRAAELEKEAQAKVEEASEKVVHLLRKSPAVSAVAAGGAAFVLASAVGAAEVAVAAAGAYAAYRWLERSSGRHQAAHRAKHE